MLVLVNELTVSAAIPKSHNLMWPAVLIRIFDGFTSVVNIMADQDYKMLSSTVHNEYIDIPFSVVCIPRCKTLRLAFRK